MYLAYDIERVYEILGRGRDNSAPWNAGRILKSSHDVFRHSDVCSRLSASKIIKFNALTIENSAVQGNSSFGFHNELCCVRDQQKEIRNTKRESETQQKEAACGQSARSVKLFLTLNELEGHFRRWSVTVSHGTAIL